MRSPITLDLVLSRWVGLVGVASLSFYLFSGSFVQLCDAERDSTLFCGACIALVDELNWQTGITDPKKKIQIGNYRLNAQGDLTLNEVPLATSEIHLTEIFESICRYMWNYVMRVAPAGDVYYILKTSREGRPISREYITESDEIKRSLQFTCDTILEEHDDWMIKQYQAQDEEIGEKLCVTKAGLCTSHNVSEHMWAYASAVMMGMTDSMPPQDDEKKVTSSDELSNRNDTETNGHDDVIDDDDDDIDVNIVEDNVVDIDADSDDNERSEL